MRHEYIGEPIRTVDMWFDTMRNIWNIDYATHPKQLVEGANVDVHIGQLITATLTKEQKITVIRLLADDLGVLYSTDEVLEAEGYEIVDDE